MVILRHLLQLCFNCQRKTFQTYFVLTYRYTTTVLSFRKTDKKNAKVTIYNNYSGYS